MDVVKAKQNKNYNFEIIIGILTIIISQIIFKIIKANQISNEILITVMMLGGIIFAVSIAKQKEKNVNQNEHRSNSTSINYVYYFCLKYGVNSFSSEPN